MEKTFVWFDLGYTLVYSKREKVFQAFLRQNGDERSEDEIARAYHLADKLFMRAYPGVLGGSAETFLPWYMGVLNHQLHVKHDLIAQCEALRRLRVQMVEDWEPFPFTLDVLNQLKRNGYGIGLISNWDRTAANVLDRTGIKPLLDHVVVSSEVGIEKPDRRIFELALEQTRLSPTECLYVGDNYYDDVVGSAKVRMDCLLLNRFGRLGIEEIEHDAIASSIQDVLPALSGSLSSPYEFE